MNSTATHHPFIERRQFVGIAAVILLIAALNLPACQTAPSDEAAPIVIGMEFSAVNSLIFIAENQGYFAANDLAVTIQEYPSGRAAVDGMLADEVDLATAAEFVIVGQALENKPILALASIDKFIHNYLIARKDHGIENVADLEGKRIGLPMKTAAEFYLGRYLELQGMHLDDVTLVDVAPPELVGVLVNGEVDAVVAWQPNVQTIADQLGDGIVQWSVQNEQVTYCSLISKSAWTADHPELAERFLNSLAQAEAFYIRQPAVAQTIVQQRLGYNQEYINAIWHEHQFQLSIDQSLILALEDEARWMIQNNLTTEKQPPDFLSFIYLEGLLAVKPEAVNIIR